MPRAGLTTSRVVEAAEAIEDAGTPVTLARLASDLEVRVPSLYKHVAGLDDLRGLMATSAKNDLTDHLAASAIGKSRADAITALCFSYRAWTTEHPSRYRYILRAPDPDNPAESAASRRAVEVITTVLAGYGLTGDNAIDATRAIRAALHGFVSLEAANGFGMPGVERSFSRLVWGIETMIASWGTDTL